MARKQFSGGAAQTTLSAGIGSSDLSLSVATGGSGYPDGSVGPFVIVIGRGTPTEEKVLCTARSGNNFTIDPSGRGYDGTTAGSWSSGSTVNHCIDALTMTDLSGHVYDATRHDHTQYARVGSANTFTAKQDLLSDSEPQLHVRRASGFGTANEGLNVTAYGAAAVVFAGGAEFDGTDSTARAATASQIEILNGGINLYADTSLTSGSTYTRTKVFAIDNTGRVVQKYSGSDPGAGGLAAQQLSWFVDEAGNALRFRVKYANGTTSKLGSVTLA